MPKKKQSWLRSETMQLAVLVIAGAALVSLLTNHVSPTNAVTATIALFVALVRLARGKDT